MSRYDLFRRRLAPIALFLALALIARDSCNDNHRTHATVRLTFGDGAAKVRAVDVDIVLGGATFARFHRSALPDRAIGPVEIQLSVPQDDGELRIDVDLGATRQQLTRRFHAVEGATITVDVPVDSAL